MNLWAQVTGLLAILIVAASPASAQTDENEPSIVVSQIDTTFTEGEEGVYSLVLTTEPSGNVDVSFSSPLPSHQTRVSVTSGSLLYSNFGFRNGSLRFTVTNWNVPKMVTVAADNDTDDSTNVTVRITHQASGGGYGDVEVADAVFTVRDNDERGVVISRIDGRDAVIEGGSVEYSVRFKTRSAAGDVVLSFASSVSDGYAVADLGVLRVFGVGSSAWDRVRRVEIRVTDNDVDAADGSVVISHSVTGGDYDSVRVEPISFTIEDDDERGLLVSKIPGQDAVNEGGHVDYSVRLNSSPSGGDVRVTLASPVLEGDYVLEDGDGITLNPGDPDAAQDALTFDAENWNQSQTVRIAVADNDVDTANGEVMITHSVSGADYEEDVNLDGQVIRFVIIDNDTRGLTIMPAMIPTDLPEGQTLTLSLSLNTRPTGQVTVAAIPGDSGHFNVTTTPVSISPDQWGMPGQQLEIGVTDDDVDSDDQDVLIRFQVMGGDYGGVSLASVMLTLRDNNERGVTIMPTRLTVDEGQEGVYTVVLDSQPTAQVDVRVGTEAPAGYSVMLSGVPLAFDADDWNIPQEVTVRSVENFVDAPDGKVTITHSVSGGDYDRPLAQPVPPVTLSIQDNDERGVNISPTALRLNEGEGAGYLVRLKTEPTDPVMVTPMPGALGGFDVEITAVGNAPGDLALHFNRMNWNVSRTLMITVNRDFEDLLPEDGFFTLQIGHGVASSGDYLGGSAPEVSVEIRDTDRSGLSLKSRNLLLYEGSEDPDKPASDTLEVALTSKPSNDVRVAISLKEGSPGDDGLAWGVEAGRWKSASNFDLLG